MGKITIKEIAKLTGVSPGTVDRALHDRGRVNPEVAIRIKEVAKEYGFQANRIARALPLSKNPIKIGVILPLIDTTFMQEVLKGILTAEKELENMGGKLIVEKLYGLEAQEEISAVERLLEQGIQGLAIAPVEDQQLREKLQSLDIPIVTFNTDISDLNTLCFIGLDNYQSGRAAAGLMDMLLGKKGGKVLVIVGFMTNQSQNQRTLGFLDEVKQSFPMIEVLPLGTSRDLPEEAKKITIQTLNDFPDLAGIVMIPGGQAGVCDALKSMSKQEEVKLIVYDLLPETIQGLNENIIDFIIDQNAMIQGKKPSMILFEYLFNQIIPENKLQYTNISIKTRFNI